MKKELICLTFYNTEQSVAIFHLFSGMCYYVHLGSLANMYICLPISKDVGKLIGLFPCDSSFFFCFGGLEKSYMYIYI